MSEAPYLFRFLVYTGHGDDDPREIETTDLCALLSEVPERPVAVSMWNPTRKQWEAIGSADLEQIAEDPSDP